ncbi:MAG: DUF4907 domain-containing protein [Bacteroidales bacterium]|nr:DUF4907 domain-containing protein [Bacteroidales bacterium]MBN2757211.1 DUF4907 domain-containing protein [Bacteroidales bacterium]
MNFLTKILKIVFLFILIFFLFSCGDDNKKSSVENAQECENEQIVTVEAIKLDTGWGYDIYIDGKRYIHQYIIPEVSGMHTFSSKEKALKTANLVVQKIKNGIIPPFVTEKELDSLDVLN